MAEGSLKLDILLSPSGDFRADAELIRRAERSGYDTAWLAENGRTPYFALTIAAADTCRIQLGSWSAQAFPRSPMVTAQIAWDLARQSGGRFVLGLDGGLPSHVEDHDGEELQSRLGRMREYVEGLRAIWDTFQTDARLRYRGKHYTFRLMAPFFNPGPIDTPDIPIFLSGAGPALCQLAGECCQGVLAPMLHSRTYLKSVLLPALGSGLKLAARVRSDIVLAAPVFVVSGKNKTDFLRAKQAAKRQIAHLLRLPANRNFNSSIGWEEIADEIKALAASDRWEQLPEAIADDTLDTVAIVAEPQDVRTRLQERYGGVVDRVCVFVSNENAGLIETIVSV